MNTILKCFVIIKITAIRIFTINHYFKQREYKLELGKF